MQHTARVEITSDGVAVNDTAAVRPNPLALARFLRGWTQAELGAQAGRSKDTVKRIEAGATPRLTTAVALARALRVSVDVLFPYNDEEAAGQRPPATTSTAAGTRDDAILQA